MKERIFLSVCCTEGVKLCLNTVNQSLEAGSFQLCCSLSKVCVQIFTSVEAGAVLCADRGKLSKLSLVIGIIDGEAEVVGDLRVVVQLFRDLPDIISLTGHGPGSELVAELPCVTCNGQKKMNIP